MTMFTRFVLIAIFMMFAAPAFAGQALQMWHCEIDEEVLEEDAIAGLEKWLAAAKQVKGGESLEMKVLFPVAVNSDGDFDMWIMVTTDSLEAWGRFWDHYPDSAAGDLEDENEDMFICPDSGLWEVYKSE